MSTNRFLPIGILGAILLLPPCSAAAQPATEIPNWVTAEAGPQQDCPLSAAAGTSNNPGFNFGGTTDAPDFHCHQTGPFSWDGKKWYVQRIHSLTTNSAFPKPCTDAGLSPGCLFNGTRVCSKQGANIPTPAGTDAGSGGCGVYLSSVKFHK
jgi:hypothetical protein